MKSATTNRYKKKEIQTDIKTDINQNTKIGEQFDLIPKTAFDVRNQSNFPNLANIASKCLTKILPDSYAELSVKHSTPSGKQTTDINADVRSLFVDLRKKQSFDWVKTTNAYQRIIHLSDLEDKWDGYNAPTFPKAQIDRALSLYSGIRGYSINRGINSPKIEPFVAPGSDGTILFEWAGKRFPVRQLEVYVPREEADLFEYLKTEGDSESEGEFNLEGLYPILDWLFIHC